MMWKKAILLLAIVIAVASVIVILNPNSDGPSGLASCKDCKKVSQSGQPDHSILMIVLTLVIAVVGAHSLGHFCKNPMTKRIVVLVFLGGFVLLGAVFGVAIANPTTAFAVVAERATSVGAAVGLLVLFAILSIELRTTHHGRTPKQNVWRDLEEAEEKWRGK